MGKFFSALHVKSSKDRFIREFTQLMKKDGYVPCLEDEAAVSYAAAFSDGGWATLSNGDDSANELSKTATIIAGEMKTSCFTAEAVDSDFAILELHVPSGRTSRIVVGNGGGYGVEKAPFSADDWKPLLQNGDIEKFLAVIGQDSVFVEDALYDIGKILGITSAVMTWCYDEFQEKIGQDENVIPLSFRKAAEKKITLNAAFKQVFGEALEPFGFKLIKSKHPYFVRLVSDEIIHVISYYNHRHGCDHDNNIVIKGGVATVYRKEIDLTHNPRRENWLTTNCSIYIYRLERNLEKLDVELKHRLYYHPSAPEDILDEMEYQLALTKRFILPALDKAVTIDSCIEHNFEIGMSLSFYNDGCFGETYGNSYYDEGMLYFKTDWSVFENAPDDMDQMALYKKSFFEKNHVDFDLYKKAQVELERRKAANIRILKSYGIDL